MQRPHHGWQAFTPALACVSRSASLRMEQRCIFIQNVYKHKPGNNDVMWLPLQSPQITQLCRCSLQIGMMNKQILATAPPPPNGHHKEHRASYAQNVQHGMLMSSQRTLVKCQRADAKTIHTPRAKFAG